jgi:hypothetical protein
VWFLVYGLVIMPAVSDSAQDYGDFVEQADDFCELSNGVLVFRVESGMSRMRTSKRNADAPMTLDDNE